ncbi:MAG: GNAT family N-acetyltransferase [Anaerolineae bacterium]|nr:GNAT family N-acetyltransferase [Anaerolineae bacterium]
MTSYNFKLCSENDTATIIDFLMTVKDELYLPDRAAIEAMMTLICEQGGVVGAYDGETLCGMMGFFYGEPTHDYDNKEIVFLYVAAIADEYRLSRVFHKGLLFALRQFKQMGKSEIRLQAEAANPYTNKLYARFANYLYASKTLRGVPVNTYGGSITTALSCLARRSRTSQSVPAPAPAF